MHAKNNPQQGKKRVAATSSKQQQPVNEGGDNPSLLERPTKKIKESSSSSPATITTTTINQSSSDQQNHHDIISKELKKSLPYDPHFSVDISNNNEKQNKEKKQSHIKPIKALPQKSRKKQKSEERKKKKVEEKKAKESMRQQLIESHQKNTLKDEELKLLKPIGSIGIGSETTKQELQRKAIYEQLGIKEETAPKAEKFWNKRNPEFINEKWNEQGLQLNQQQNDEEELITINNNSIIQSSSKMEDDSITTKEEKKPLMVLDFFGSGNTISNIPVASLLPKKETVQDKKEETSLFYDSDDDPTSGLNLEDMGKSHNQLIDSMIEKLDQSKTDEEKEIKFTRFYVTVKRKPEIQDQRMLLPICGEEQRIMETINENEITIVKGETGSGKTTQIPQFLYEYGYGRIESGYPGIIGITQPRRVAAVSTAKRVAEELNVVFGEEVAYQVRFDKNVSAEKTKIKFMTDGILMREIQTDPLLLQYSVIALDEIHERNVNTDILIGWLSRFIPQRNRMAAAGLTTPEGKSITPLKLIIMSATLQLENFTDNTKLFANPPPVVDVQSRQYPVVVHFNKRTVFNDYMEAAYKKVVKIHENLPNGGILIFLTGRKEIEFLVEKLKSYSTKRYVQIVKKEMSKSKLQKEQEEENQKNAEEEENLINQLGDLSDSEDEADISSSKKAVGLHEDENMFDDDDNNNLDQSEEANNKEINKEEEKGKSETVTLFQDNIKSDKVKKEGEENNAKLNSKKKAERLYVLPLYAMLQPHEQMKVFNNPPEGHRLVVVATNVAETSLTIPNVRFVVDCGRIKEKQFEKSTGIFKFQIGWTSQASANQRAGRAGRTGPGHCYRLFSSAVFDQRFKNYTEPDILRAPIENIILQMKSMGIKQVEKFPFPTPPDSDSVKKGVDALVNLGALDKFISNEGNIETMITKMGSAMNRFPLHPRFAKMLILSNNNPELLLYTAGAVSVMTVQQIFMHDNHLTLLKEKIERRKQEELKEKISRLGMKSDTIDKNKKMQIDLEEIEEEQAAEGLLESSSSEEKIKEEKQYLDEQEIEMRTKCKEIKKMWSHPLSDHLAMLKAVGAYLYADDPKDFCLEYMLHQKNMREVKKLHRQLLNTVRSELKASALEMDDADDDEILNDNGMEEEEKKQAGEPTIVEFPEPKDDEDEQYQIETAIRQIICAGMVDQVARLATVDDLAHMDVSYKETSRPYVTLSLGRSVPVFIHPGSCLFGRHPEFIVFTEMTKSRKNKTYMRGVTAIEPNWISRFGNSKCGFVKFSEPLESPAPFYDYTDDCVKCFVRPTIHQSATGTVWTLPIEPIEYKADGSRQVTVFAKSILEGKVFESIKLSKENMLNLPTLIQSKRFLDLTISLKKLFPQGLKCSKAKLIAKWKVDSSFLRNELTQVLGVKQLNQWPPEM